jgi:predicted thioesterase
MLDVRELFQEGETLEANRTVQVDDTVGNFSVHLNQLLSTTACIERMVRMSTEMVEGRLPEGFITVGLSYSVRHDETAMLGTGLSYLLKLEEIKGNRLVFSMKITDSIGEVFHATCERAIVNRYELIDSATERAKKARES